MPMSGIGDEVVLALVERAKKLRKGLVTIDASR